MNVFVAGGAGFIGSHLIDRLLKDGNRVVCADKLVMGKDNIMHLANNNMFTLLEADLSDQKTVDRLFLNEKYDVVYHIAANSDIKKGGQEPSLDFVDTFLTTKSILEGMRKANMKKLFFSSTSAVYGEMPDVELNEKTGGLTPTSFYGGAKLASEAIISSYTSMCDMSAVVFRFPNVIGPRLTHGVIYDFLNKLKSNPRCLEILGDGTQCKPYIYVYDLIDAIMKITSNFINGLQLYNISTKGRGTTVRRIAEIIVEELKLKEVAFLFTGGDRGWKGDVPCFSYDISKILSTGWLPLYSSEEAVQKTVRDMIGDRF